MTNLQRLRDLAPKNRNLTHATRALALVFVLSFATNAAYAQTLHVIYSFRSFLDGAQPYSGVTIRADTLYGTTHSGNEGTNWGDVYQLRHAGSGWLFTGLQLFDGTLQARPAFGPDGILYGTSPNNIAGLLYGYVYSLTPRLSVVCSALRCPWPVAVLYAFGNGPDGGVPRFGEMVFNGGKMYNTASTGGINNNGVVYEMTRSGSGWTEQPIYQFTGTPDGALPFNTVVFDSAGNMYGTTMLGGQFGFGSVFELSPSGSGWTERVLYSFQNGTDGSSPAAGLVLDQAGNLYGAASSGGAGHSGTVFQLTPSGGGYAFNLLKSFSGQGACGPFATLSMDAAGSVYGTTFCSGANGFGNVFKLTPSGGGWTYTSLYDFLGGADGKRPYSNVSFDSLGNLYGTTSAGGANGSGEVWQITP